RRIDHEVTLAKSNILAHDFLRFRSDFRIGRLHYQPCLAPPGTVEPFSAARFPPCAWHWPPAFAGRPPGTATTSPLGIAKPAASYPYYEAGQNRARMMCSVQRPPSQGNHCGRIVTDFAARFNESANLLQ